MCVREGRFRGYYYFYYCSIFFSRYVCCMADGREREREKERKREPICVPTVVRKKERKRVSE